MLVVTRTKIQTGRRRHVETPCKQELFWWLDPYPSRYSDHGRRAEWSSDLSGISTMVVPDSLSAKPELLGTPNFMQMQFWLWARGRQGSENNYVVCLPPRELNSFMRLA
jgi:hypothetical protein